MEIFKRNAKNENSKSWRALLQGHNQICEKEG